jgi:uncharacterized repeat protein (TIGR01451 family)
MRKIPVLLVSLLGLFVLTPLTATLPLESAIATEPTPTLFPTQVPEPPGLPNDTLCHLAAGKHCQMINSLDVAASEASSANRTNPLVGARGVPTYTLISATFDRAMDAASFTPDTFYVVQGTTRIAGSISYIDTSNVAVFSPATPLLPNMVYTATLSPEVRDLGGIPLVESRVWTFTTRSGVSPLAQSMATADLSAQAMNIYLGDLHSHSGYSDGQGTPAQAYATGRANGLDFMALSDHDIMLSPAEWEDVKQQANAANVSGQFVALASFEYSHLYGHINVFDSETLISRDDPNYDTLDEFYNWLIAHPTAFAEFNHPKKEPAFDWNFNDFAFNPQADQKIVLQELETAGQFFLSLNSGWHLGTLKNHDTHFPNWGSNPWLGVVAPGLTRESILAALRARRTFFVSPSDSNLGLMLQANGYWMGSAIPNTNVINFTVTAYDPNPDGRPLRLFIYNNGIRVASTTLPANTVYTWTPTVAGQLGHYYYAEVYYNGWLYPAYSSPIWVERPPLAEAGAAQYVAPGSVVTLDGRASWDPDGDALAYHWSQDSGPAASLNNANSAQPSFVAPGALGDTVFRLIVVDTGSLSAADTTRVSITNAPILSISKSGPVKAEPGEPINYILTVTNHGITPANGVVIEDAVPAGATYVSGGTPLPGNIVSWTVPNLAANGGTAQVNFTVTAAQPIVNFDYRASCSGCIPATGNVAVFTNGSKIYLPVIRKN